ncbi:TetR/AcrR family transcriptional regulator C-terminal domain-containing protein [Silvibacterium dinghuense]|uniref:Transcriptional regulator TetR C-terminal Proteobacteria type domain-containing protein n=1 Tax=Silvibacterium dinghuense TaxID=1560006 RepID=A0A4Q1SDF0_9BACT|nr:hypothetical protein ESZ00_10860 [Silvibacterium dinghuense]
MIAEHFMSLVAGGPIRWFGLGLKQKPLAQEAGKHVDAAVRVILRTYAIESLR